MKSLLQRYSLLSYFVLAYGIAWGLILLIMGVEGFHTFRGESVLSEGVTAADLFLLWLAMLAGPSIAGILMSWVADGPKGLSKLWSSITRWRVSPQWYAMALLLIPGLLAIITYSLLSTSTAYEPGLLIGMGIAGGMIGGFFEEIGWTGFATSRLHKRFGLFYAGIILGIVHTCWHWLPDYWGAIDLYQELYAFHFLLWIVALTAFRLITVWIYTRTQSTLLAQLTHGSFTGGQMIFGSPTATGQETLLWYGIFAGALCVVAAVVVAVDRKIFFNPITQ